MAKGWGSEAAREMEQKHAKLTKLASQLSDESHPEGESRRERWPLFLVIIFSLLQ